MENTLVNMGQNSIMDNFVKTDDILKDMCGIIESSQKIAYKAVNASLIQRNWLIGYRIAEEELQGEIRSEYGLQIIKSLSKELTQLYGKGYDRSNLYHCLRFYKMFPEIVDTMCRQSANLLSWSHYRALLQIENEYTLKLKMKRGTETYQLLYAKNLTDEQIKEYNANRPKEDDTEVELVIDFYQRFIYRMEYMLRVGKEKGYNLISFMGP